MVGRERNATADAMIPIAKPFLGHEEASASSEAIASGWVTQGPKVQEFENAFKKYVGAQHACAVSSCTAALHVSLLAIGVKPGNVVLTVSHSFIATANSIRYCNAEPVFIDVECATYNMDPKKLEAVLTSECERRENGLYYKDTTRLAAGESPLAYVRESAEYGRVAAVLVVHQMGLPCDLAALSALARKYNLPIVEDAACAIGSEASKDQGGNWEKIGKPHGDIACFSFHPRKILTTGDGGMITSNDASLDQKVRLLRHQGMSISDLERDGQAKVVFESYEQTAFNYRMTDIQAAVGIEQLKRIPAAVKKRRELATLYRDLLKEISWIKVVEEPVYAHSNWQSFPVFVAEDAPISRDKLMQYLLDHGISTRRGIMNAHQERPYSQQNWDLPVSIVCRDQSMLLPIFHTMTNDDIEHIVRLIKNA